jgi:hypothetical protein
MGSESRGTLRMMAAGREGSDGMMMLAGYVLCRLMSMPSGFWVVARVFEERGRGEEEVIEIQSRWRGEVGIGFEEKGVGERSIRIWVDKLGKVEVLK